MHCAPNFPLKIHNCRGLQLDVDRVLGIGGYGDHTYKHLLSAVKKIIKWKRF